MSSGFGENSKAGANSKDYVNSPYWDKGHVKQEHEMYLTAPTKNGLSIEIKAVEDALELLSIQRHLWNIEQKEQHKELSAMAAKWSDKTK